MSTAPSPGWKAPLAMRQGRSNRPVTARHPLGLAPNSWARTVVKNGKGVQQFLRCCAPTSSPNVQLRVTPRLSPLLLYSARGREYVRVHRPAQEDAASLGGLSRQASVGCQRPASDPERRGGALETRARLEFAGAAPQPLSQVHDLDASGQAV